MARLSLGAEFAGYVIVDVIGRGGMGVIYRASQLRPERPVALKVVAPELAADVDFRARFLREAQIAASIEHPHVVPVLGVGEEDGLLFIAMRLIPGRDLAAVIGADGRLEPERAARIVDQVADALDTAHEQGLVHRDVKPANVLVESRRRGEHAYLTDFGLTKSMALSGGLTSTGVVVGTTNYMPPEQWQGGRLDARVDVYSLGCVLFEALTGRVPYEREGQAARMYAHLTEPPPKVSSLVPAAAAFDDVIVRALAKDPADRYPSAGDLGYAAVAAADSRPVTRPERSIAVGDAAPRSEQAETQLEATRAEEQTPTVVQPKTRAAGSGFSTPTRRPTRVTATRRAAERSEARSSNALALIILGIVALAGIAAAALAAGGAFSHSTSRSTTQTTLASQPQAKTTRPAGTHTTTVVKTVVVQQSAPLSTAPVSVPASASAQVTATGGWPAGTSAWTVVLKSASTQAAAQQAASTASAAGVSETGVLMSTDHSSLRRGYWVAFSGVLTHDEAVARTTQAHAAGFSDAYVRYVSAS
jgi:serine/threonine protein kinase